MSPNSQAIPGAAVQLGQNAARFVDEAGPLEALMRYPGDAPAAAPPDQPLSNGAKLAVALAIAGGVYLGWKLNADYLEY